MICHARNHHCSVTKLAETTGFAYAAISARALFLASSNDVISVSFITGQSNIQSPPASAFIAAIETGSDTITRTALYG
jgi:hypothetical protein